MSDAIQIDALNEYLEENRPDLGAFVTHRGTGGRSAPNHEAWLPIVEHGFRSTANPDGIPGTRRNVKPGFVGDGTMRFEASGQIDSALVDAMDVLNLIEEALKYLCSELPDRYSATPPPSSQSAPTSALSTTH